MDKQERIQAVRAMDTIAKMKKELMREARTFSIYYGREELMSEGTRKRYEAFCEKCRIYEEETKSRASRRATA